MDSNILGLLTNPRLSPEVLACLKWEATLKAAGNTIAVPSLIVYEVKRELKRAGKIIGLWRLEEYLGTVLYLPATDDVLEVASDFWSDLRKSGLATAPKEAVDFDTILAAHANVLTATGDRAIVVSTNIKHLSRMTETYDWRDPIWKTF